MCGIAGIVSLSRQAIPQLGARLERMNQLIAHRGPDGSGIWRTESDRVGFGHRRLAIIDLSESGAQPMVAKSGHVLTYNGEIYNYRELRSLYSSRWNFESQSDSEVILAGFVIEGERVLTRLRGMFAFAIWDPHNEVLFCARDHFGVKPFYFTQNSERFHFASEAKALLPFVESIETNHLALEEYFSFQYTLGSHTLFQDIFQLQPGHQLVIQNGSVRVSRYWDIPYELDETRSEDDFVEEVRWLTRDAVRENLVSDVEVGTYVSGGFDSSLVYLLGAEIREDPGKAFHGRFAESPLFDESEYAREVVDHVGGQIYEADIAKEDFVRVIHELSFHMDYPAAGPGSFPQYVVSALASENVKVVLGGQGGDEIFGGYARYLVAYLNQTLRAAVDGEQLSTKLPVGLQTLTPGLGVLREYKPMIGAFFSNNLFGSGAERYFELVNRSESLSEILRPRFVDHESVFNRFIEEFQSQRNFSTSSYFDSMLHFDFKNLLPALLQVEDRVSMAHGLESRVPMLDRRLVELVSAVPTTLKLGEGNLKRLLKLSFEAQLPERVRNRRDKMGFPVPLSQWSSGPLRGFFADMLSSRAASSRSYLAGAPVVVDQSGPYSRNTWALLSLELWQTRYHDSSSDWKWRGSS